MAQQTPNDQTVPNQNDQQQTNKTETQKNQSTTQDPTSKKENQNYGGGDKEHDDTNHPHKQNNPKISDGTKDNEQTGNQRDNDPNKTTL